MPGEPRVDLDDREGALERRERLPELPVAR
jgi:hypothetical protein